MIFISIILIKEKEEKMIKLIVEKLNEETLYVQYLE